MRVVLRQTGQRLSLPINPNASFLHRYIDIPNMYKVLLLRNLVWTIACFFTLTNHDPMVVSWNGGTSVFQTSIRLSVHVSVTSRAVHSLVVDHRQYYHVECLEVPCKHRQSSVLLHHWATVAGQVRDAVASVYRAPYVRVTVKVRQRERLKHTQTTAEFWLQFLQTR